MKTKFIIFLVTIFSAFAVSSCSTTYTQAKHNYEKTAAEIHHKEAMAKKIALPVVTKTGYYVNAQPISLKRTPSWLKRRVSMQAHQIPLAILMRRLLRDTNVNVTYDNTVNPRRLVSMNYTGSIKGALKTLSAQLNYFYALDHGTLDWSAFMVKTFNISFMPGASTYLVGRTRNSNNHNQQNYGNGTHVSRIDDQQYSNLQGRLSVWDDLHQTLDQLKSKEGHVVISESTTMVTAKDHPANIEAMTKYIARLNKSLSQQVAIRVEVLDIELNKDYNFGIDWNVVAKELHKDWPALALTGNLSTATNLVASNLVGSPQNSAVSGFRIGNEDGSNALINALNKQGRLRVVTKPEVVTMNNQIASIRITQDTGYIESVNQSYAENYVTTSITPGTVTDGFTLYLLPKIEGSKVYMQISSTISNLVRLEKQSTIPAGVDANNSSKRSNQQYNAIEVPTISEKVFNQRSVVRTGSTLIIAGYKRLRDQTSAAKFYGVSALGGHGAKTDNIETLVLITPTILRSQN